MADDADAPTVLDGGKAGAAGAGAGAGEAGGGVGRFDSTSRICSRS